MIWLRLSHESPWKCLQRNDTERNTVKKKDCTHLKLLNLKVQPNISGTMETYFVQRAANTSSCNGESIFAKSHLLKWTLIMSESAPLEDNVHNFQRGHNGKHLIRWSLMKLHHQSLNGFCYSTRPLRAERHLCRVTQRPNKSPLRAFKEAETDF